MTFMTDSETLLAISGTAQQLVSGVGLFHPDIVLPSSQTLNHANSVSGEAGMARGRSPSSRSWRSNWQSSLA